MILAQVFTTTIFAQAKKENDNSKPLSKHEIGFSYHSDQLPVRSLPFINYRYYRTDKKMLHFSLTGAYSPFYQSAGVRFWNERRKYLGADQKWFFSRGLTLNAGFSNFDYELNWSNPSELVGMSFGVGYGLGLGYQLDKHFTITSKFEPSLNLLHTKSGARTNSLKFRSPLSIGLNYRF